MKLGSLFDGIGGFPLAAQRCGIEPVWASEIEQVPIEITKTHFPNMVHLGDITQINGAEIEPVDIITAGSPCQDLSVAGKRAGLEGERSGLFMEFVRIVREMREATNGAYPKFIVWENVPGAFSSNKGEDFRAVLEEIMEAPIPMPYSGKWAKSGMVRGNGRSLAWRVLDAQYFGVPQRRKRIFLVADFTGGSAAEILFEQEGVRGDTAESREAWQEVAATTEGGVGKTSYGVVSKGNGDAFITPERHMSLTSGGGQAGQGYPCALSSQELVAATTREGVEGTTSWCIDHVVTTGGNCTAQGPCVKQEMAYTLKASGVHAVAAPVERTGAIAFNGDQSAKTRSMGESVEQSPTLRAGGPVHVAYPTIPIHDKATRSKAGNGLGIGSPDDPSPTLTAGDRHAVLHPQLGSGKRVTGALLANCGEKQWLGNQEAFSGDFHILQPQVQNPVRIGYAVRRLTPTECERLMGFPDGWTDGGSDTARYKALGNSVAVPCVEWIMRRLVAAVRSGEETEQ